MILLLARAFDSVELTDEVHGIASIYNIYLGKVPFMTSWDYHTGWCLLVPLFALYHKLVPSLSGVVLYFRVIYLLFTGLNAVIIASLLRDRNNREGGHVGLYVFPVLFFVPFSIFQINYNTFVIQVLIKTYFLRVFSILIFGYVVAVNMFTKKCQKKQL